METSKQAQPSSQSPLQYYVGVGTPDSKQATLRDLLQAFLPSAPLFIALVCSSRDSLDEACLACMGIDQVRLHCLHANLSEVEAMLVMRHCRAQAQEPALAAEIGAADALPGRVGDADAPMEESRSRRFRSNEVLATTDTALRLVPRDALPAGASLLIQYDLPPAPAPGLARSPAAARVSSLLRVSQGKQGSGRPGVVISFVTAGPTAGALREYAAGLDRKVAAMPIRVAEIFGEEGRQTGHGA